MPAARPPVSPADPACRAPFTSMFLDQRGTVQACCMNDMHQLGNIADRSLAEIWFGESAERLRRAVGEGDLSLGCQPCTRDLDGDEDDLAYARTFDHIPYSSTDPRWPTQLDLSLSNACNLECVMCNGEWSSSIRSRREHRPPLPTVYHDAFFAEMEAFVPHLRRVNLRGGEPFLAAETLRILELLVERAGAVDVGVTTNGTQWSPRIERILELLPLNLAVSLDAATAATYEAVRVGGSWATVRENLDRFQRYVDASGTTLTISFCLMTVNWHELAPFCWMADDLGLPSVVNTVTQPGAVSLFRLPPEQLRSIVADLEAVEAEHHDRFGASRSTWLAELRRLQGHLARSGSSAVPVAAPLRRPAPDPVAATIRLDHQGIVEQTEATSLVGLPATALGGMHGSDLPAALAEWVGPVTTITTGIGDHGATRYEVCFVDGRRLGVELEPVVDTSGLREATVLRLRWNEPEGPAPTPAG